MATMTAGAPATGARVDPLPEFLFLVEIGGLAIGAFAECSGLEVQMEAAEYAEGGENGFVHRFRGRMRHPNLVLKRGVTNETALMQWLLDCREKTERKEGSIVLVSPTGERLRGWKIAAAFPVKWQGPTLNANSNGWASETLEIAHHGLLPAS